MAHDSQALLAQPAVAGGAQRARSARSFLPTGRARRMLLAGCALAGLALCVGVVRSVAAPALWAALARMRPMLPWLFGLELARVACELASTASLLGSVRRRVPWLELCRVQGAAAAFNTVLPAGRAASEGVKAGLLVQRVGVGTAVANAAGSQLLVLWVNAGLAAIGLLVLPAGRLLPALATAVFGYAALTAGIGAVMLVALRLPALRARLSRWPALGASLDAFAGLWRDQPRGLCGAALAQALGRVVQLSQFALMLAALGGQPGVLDCLLAQLVCLTAGALGELVPAQLGAIDGAFVVAAPGLSLAPSQAAVLGLTLHALQLGVAALCVAFWFGTGAATSRRRTAAPSSDTRPSPR